MVTSNLVKGGARLRFRISTLLLFLVACALSLGWYFDRPPDLKTRLIGVWQHPFPGVGYWETLSFEPTGRFARVVQHRFGRDRFTGTFRVDDDNNVYFIFEKRSSPQDEMRELTADEKELADCCALCAFDSHGRLLIVNVNPRVAYADFVPSDECYIPSRHYESSVNRKIASDSLLDALEEDRKRENAK